MLHHILLYYTFVLPLSLPWIVSLFFLGRYFGSKNAIKAFALDARAAQMLATKSTTASLIICLPFALLMPFWCGMNLLLYFVLAVGVQYFSITLSLPTEDNAKKWRWSWASNAAAVGISTVFFVATLACVWIYSTQMRGLQPPVHSGYSHTRVGGNIDTSVEGRTFSAKHRSSGYMTYSDGSRSEMTDWYTVPTWYAGKWRMDGKKMTKATGGDWKKTDSKTDVEYFVGQYADKTGQIWQHKGLAGWSHSDYYPFCGSYGQKEYYFGAKKGIPYSQMKHEKFAVCDGDGLQSEDADQLYCGNGGGKILVHADDSFEQSEVIKTSDTKTAGIVYMHEYTARAKRIAPFKPRAGLKTPDGQPLYPDFVGFLKEYGMADRIPPEPK